MSQPEDNTLGITQDQVNTLSPEGRTALAAALEKAGYTPDQRTKLGLGTFTPPNTPAAKSEPMSLDQANLELRLNALRLQEAGTSPSEYRFVLPPPAVRELTPEKANQLVGFLQYGLHGAGIPKQSASLLVREMMASATEYKLATNQADFEAKQIAALKSLRNFGQAQIQWSHVYSKLPEDFRKAADKAGYFKTASALLALASAGAFMLRRDGGK